MSVFGLIRTRLSQIYYRYGYTTEQETPACGISIARLTQAQFLLFASYLLEICVCFLVKLKSLVTRLQVFRSNDRLGTYIFLKSYAYLLQSYFVTISQAAFNRVLQTFRCDYLLTFIIINTLADPYNGNPRYA